LVVISGSALISIIRSTVSTRLGWGIRRNCRSSLLRLSGSGLPFSRYLSIVLTIRRAWRRRSQGVLAMKRAGASRSLRSRRRLGTVSEAIRHYYYPTAGPERTVAQIKQVASNFSIA
jgi:hypothetical protein